MIVAGAQHNCVLLETGNVQCWGNNQVGQLGIGDKEDRGDAPGEMGNALPFVDLGNETVVTLSASGYSTCALMGDGKIKCWGFNQTGQLGLGDLQNRGDSIAEMGDALPFVDLGANLMAANVSAGVDHTCALLTGGDVKCWGDGRMLGLGSQINHGGKPGEMGDALPLVNLGTDQKCQVISAGESHSCALIEGGSIKCWGYGVYGMLGYESQKNVGWKPGEMGDALPAVDLGVGFSPKDIVAYKWHTCALATSGGIKCWGWNGAGALGVGDNANRGENPGQMGDNLPWVNLGSDVAALAHGYGFDFTCALLVDHSVKCWGRGNSGQLGNGGKNNLGDEPGEMGDNLPRVKLFSDNW